MELVFFLKFTENHVPHKSLPFLYFCSSSQSEWWNFYFLLWVPAHEAEHELLGCD